MSEELVTLTAGPTDDLPEGVALLRLQKPPVNVLSGAVAAALGSALERLDTDDTIRAVIVYGGERAFAAGADVKEFAHADHTALLRRGLPLERAIARLAALPKPVVAAVNGVALGGGCELALAADVRISADDARWGQPEIQLGIIPGAGGTQRLARLVGPGRAKDIVFSGRLVAADEAYRIGLVDRVVPAADVLSAATELAGSWAHGPATALAAAKSAIDHGLGLDLEQGLALERALFAGLFPSSDKSLGIQSFIDNGPGKAQFPAPA